MGELWIRLISIGVLGPVFAEIYCFTVTLLGYGNIVFRSKLHKGLVESVSKNND